VSIIVNLDHIPDVTLLEVFAASASLWSILIKFRVYDISTVKT